MTRNIGLALNVDVGVTINYAVGVVFITRTMVGYKIIFADV